MSYSDVGVLPRAALRAVLRDPTAMWSLHSLSGAWPVQCALFAVAALLAGYRARAAAALSWLLLISLHHRSPLIITGVRLSDPIPTRLPKMITPFAGRLCATPPTASSPWSLPSAVAAKLASPILVSDAFRV